MGSSRALHGLGGNVTGLSIVSTELAPKWLELLKEALPRISVVAFLLKPDSIPDDIKKEILTAAHVAARALIPQVPRRADEGAAPIPVDVKTAAQIPLRTFGQPPRRP